MLQHLRWLDDKASLLFWIMWDHARFREQAYWKDMMLDFEESKLVRSGDDNGYCNPQISGIWTAWVTFCLKLKDTEVSSALVLDLSFLWYPSYYIFSR